MPTETEIAWAAGLFEGEGCITISHNSKTAYDQPRLKLSMVDVDVVERFAAIVGVGNLCDQRFKNPKFQKQRCWYAGARKDVTRVLNMLRPYFGDRRRARCDEVLVVANPVPFEGWDYPPYKERVYA